MNPYFQYSGGIIPALLLLVALFFLFVFLPVSLVADAFSKLGLTRPRACSCSLPSCSVG